MHFLPPADSSFVEHWLGAGCFQDGLCALSYCHGHVTADSLCLELPWHDAEVVLLRTLVSQFSIQLSLEYDGLVTNWHDAALYVQLSRLTLPRLVPLLMNSWTLGMISDFAVSASTAEEGRPTTLTTLIAKA